MLYDRKWAVKTDPLTLESLIAWLETMPQHKRYNFDDCSGKCLYGLYMASHNISWRESGSSFLGKDADSPRGNFCEFVYDHVAVARPWTFGAALKRARAALVS